MDKTYIEEPDDPELLAAWEVLRMRVGNLSGWQYGGSTRGSNGWQHHFKNRRLIEEADSEDDREEAIQEVPATTGWVAVTSQPLGTSRPRP